jgi:hypothetical protein
MAHTWDSRYAHERFAYGKEPNVFIKEASLKYLSKTGKPLSIADLASGEGRNAVFLAKVSSGYQNIVMSLYGYTHR